MQDCTKKLKQIGEKKESNEKILRDTILQAVLRLRDEKKICITCRPRDRDMVEKLVPSIKQELIEKILNGEGDMDLTVGPMKSLKRTKDFDTEVDKEGWLHDSGCGGVVICAHGDEMKVNNTLEKRLELCFNEMIPLFREILFAKTDAQN